MSTEIEIGLEGRKENNRHSNGNALDNTDQPKDNAVDDADEATAETKLTESNADNVIEVEDLTNKYLIYGINDAPPIHITIVCALQVSRRFLNLKLTFYHFDLSIIDRHLC